MENNKRLYSLIYASQAVKRVTGDELKTILNSARVNNPKYNITGILAFNNNYFLQALEGPGYLINNLFQIISKDQRHQNVQLINYQEIDQRKWPNWSMGYASSTEENMSIYYQYSAFKEFNPYSLSALSAIKILQNLNIIQSNV